MKTHELELNIHYVECPICHRHLKEINNPHLKTHQLTSAEFDIKYPNSPRLSEHTRIGKNHFKFLSREMSEKLKFSHTLEGHKLKYGEELGVIKFNESRLHKSIGHTLEGYIQKHGELGSELYYRDNATRFATKEKWIDKFGEDIGTSKWEEYQFFLKNKNWLWYYIDKYGEEEGLILYLNKNLKSSDAHKKIQGSDVDFFIYNRAVMKYTRFSMSIYNLKDRHKISRKHANYEDCYELDHKISKVFGFNNNIAPKYIGSINNLEVIKSKLNNQKQCNCSMDVDELIKLVDNDQKYLKYIQILDSIR